MLSFLFGLLASMVLLCSCSGSGEGRRPDKILFDFETDEALDRLHWKCHAVYALSGIHATHGGRSLELTLYPSDYPGVTPLLDFHDWRAYRFFCFDMYNPYDKEALFTLRIDDRKEAPDYQDRVNRKVILSPGMNHVEIPLYGLATSGGKRMVNLKTIERFLLFQARPEEKKRFYLDHVRLVAAPVNRLGDGTASSSPGDAK